MNTIPHIAKQNMLKSVIDWFNPVLKDYSIKTWTVKFQQQTKLWNTKKN